MSGTLKHRARHGTWPSDPALAPSPAPRDLPIPGVTYAPTRPGSTAKPRTVAWVGTAPSAVARWSDEPTVGFRRTMEASQARWPDTAHDTWVFIGGWRAWVRKHAAVAVTP